MRKVTEPAIPTRQDAVLGRLAYGIGKLGTVLRNGAWADARAEGLTPTQGQILVRLRANGRAGLRLAALASELGISAATTSDAVSTLESKRLVERRPDPDDRRAIAIRLTDHGRKVAHRAMQWPAFMADALATLSDEERGAMLRGLAKTMGALERAGRMPPARMCLSCRYFEPGEASGTGPAKQRCAWGDFVLDDTDLRLDCAAHAAAL